MRPLAVTLATALIVALAANSSAAILIELTDDQVEQAIVRGRETYERYREERRALDDLDAEYIVDRGAAGKALLFTEFASIVLETRRYLAIGRRFTPHDLTPIVAPLRGRIEFMLVAYGDNRDFLRESKVVLLDGKTEHEPKIWHVNRGLPKAGATTEFVASGRYSFDARAVDTSTPAALVLRTPDGRELRFEFDLATLK